MTVNLELDDAVNGTLFWGPWRLGGLEASLDIMRALHDVDVM